jgi:hypothetical protein
MRERPAARGGHMDDEFTARYYQFHSLYEMPSESVDDAIFFLAAGLDNGKCMPKDVTRQDGTVVLDDEETLKRVHATLDEWHREWDLTNTNSEESASSDA